jgi:serine/threonine protein kinase
VFIFLSLIALVLVLIYFEHLILTEFCNGGSLDTSLHKDKKILSKEKQVEYALQIAEGMKYLHTRTPMIVHRDLKSQNILVLLYLLLVLDFRICLIF